MTLLNGVRYKKFYVHNNYFKILLWEVRDRKRRKVLIYSCCFFLSSECNILTFRVEADHKHTYELRYVINMVIK